jgi:hypothetical protein
MCRLSISFSKVRLDAKRRITAVLALLGIIVLNCSAVAFDQSAPFGFSWGPVDKIPTPSLATSHDNITLLIYRHDRLPLNELPRTEEIVLQICKDEGLQQVIWNFFPILKRVRCLEAYLRRETVDTERLRLESEAPFAGTAVKPRLPQFQMIRASTAYSWRAMGPRLMPARRSTGIH